MLGRQRTVPSDFFCVFIIPINPNINEISKKNNPWIKVSISFSVSQVINHINNNMNAIKNKTNDTIPQIFVLLFFIFLSFQKPLYYILMDYSVL